MKRLSGNINNVNNLFDKLIEEIEKTFTDEKDKKYINDYIVELEDIKLELNNF
jgi:hypothetical protein